MSTLPEDWLDELQTQLQQRGVLLYPVAISRRCTAS